MLCLDNVRRLDELDGALAELDRAVMLDGLMLVLVAAVLVVVVLAMRKAGLLPVRLLDLLPAGHG